MNPVDNIALFSRYLQHQYGDGMLFIFWLIFTFLFFAVMFLVLTILSRIAKTADQRFEADLRALYEPFLLHLLYDDTGAEAAPVIPTAIAKKLETRFQKEVFTKLVVSLNKGLDGELSDRLRNLYTFLQLHRYSQSKLSAHIWHIQASGIDELREMKITESVGAIERLLNHPNWLVRSNAQLAVLELGNPDDRLKLFSAINYPLTDWEQLRLHESLKSRNDDKISSFSSLFDSEIASVAIFGIRMSAFFGCAQDIYALQPLSYHPSEVIRREAILALMFLGDFQMQALLAEQFSSETPGVQLAIMEYLLQTGYDHLAFFEAALLNPQHKIALMAAKGIAQLNAAAFPDAYMHLAENNERMAAILAHAADRRLQRI